MDAKGKVWLGATNPQQTHCQSLMDNYSSETGELPSMLQRFLDDKPTSVEAMAMGREAIPERDRIAVAVERLRDFEGKWGTPRRKTL